MGINVPNEKFPFITCYARILDRITSLPITEFKDALKNEEPWELGIIKTSKGCSQFVVEFDIWNNERKVSAGSTQRIFNDAKNCRISVYKDRQKNKLDDNISIKIKNSFQNNSFSTLYDSFDTCGNLFNNNILSGKGEHTQVQVAIDINDTVDYKELLNFVVCFQYTDQDINVDLFFDCFVKLTDITFPIKRTMYGNNDGIFTGKINNAVINNAVIEAYNLQGKLQDQQILHSNNYSLFLKDGIYNFVIKTPSFKREFNNINVTGINPYYSQVNEGLIYEIFEDTVRYYDIVDDEEIIITEICGKLVNEYNEPLESANIIITSDNELITYFKTDSYGNYRFELKTGQYDVRLSSDNRPLKIIRDFEFIEGYGFFQEIQYKMYNFNKDFRFSLN